MEGKKGCPFHMGKLVPNAEDRSAKVVHYRNAVLHDTERFLSGDFDKGEFEDEVCQDDLKISLSSISLNYFWERLKDEPILKDKVGRDEFFWVKILANALGQSYDAVWKYNMAAVNDFNNALLSYKSNGSLSNFGDLATIELIRVLVSSSGNIHDNERFGFVVFSDLYKFCFKFFKLVLELLKDQLPPDQVDNVFKKYLAGDDLPNLLQQFMNNSLDTARFIVSRLIDNEDAINVAKFAQERDLRSRSMFFRLPQYESDLELAFFDKNKFVFDAESLKLLGSKTMEEDVQLMKEIFGSVAGRAKERRNCPALYTGMWPQMYDWARRLLLYQMYDEPYPKPEDLPETRLERVQPDLVARFRAGVRESLAKHIGSESQAVTWESDFRPYQVII